MAHPPSQGELAQPKPDAQVTESVHQLYPGSAAILGQGNEQKSVRPWITPLPHAQQAAVDSLAMVLDSSGMYAQPRQERGEGRGTGESKK